jgi:hypothetical protein
MTILAQGAAKDGCLMLQAQLSELLPKNLLFASNEV